MFVIFIKSLLISLYVLICTVWGRWYFPPQERCCSLRSAAGGAEGAVCSPPCSAAGTEPSRGDVASAAGAAGAAPGEPPAPAASATSAAPTVGVSPSAAPAAPAARKPWE